MAGDWTALDVGLTEGGEFVLDFKGFGKAYLTPDEAIELVGSITEGFALLAGVEDAHGLVEAIAAAESGEAFDAVMRSHGIAVPSGD